MRDRTRLLIQDDGGQDLIEYALLCGFVTLGVVLAVTNVGETVNEIFGAIDSEVDDIPAP